MSPSSALMTSTTVVVVRRPALLWQHPAWDLAAAAGEVLATVERMDGHEVRYQVADPGGLAVWQVEAHHSGKLSQFSVTDPAGGPVGEVEQENSLFSPALRLVTPDGATLRLDGAGRREGPWVVQDLAGQQLGSVTLTPPKRDSLPVRIYVVQRGDGLGGELWPLVVVSAICLDLVQGRK